MLSPSFVSGTTVWAATLCSGVEISPFGDARDPRAGDAYPQRLPPRRTPGAPQLRSGLKLSLDPARRFGPVGNMRRAVHPPRPGHGNISSRCVPKLSAVARYRPDAFPKGAPDEKNTGSWQHIACMHSNTANFGKICAPCIQKAPQSAVGECTARTSCRQGAFSPSEAPKSCTAHESCHPLMNLALV